MAEKNDTVLQEPQEPTNYLETEVKKLNAELREKNSEILMLKETIVRMAMKQNDVK